MGGCRSLGIARRRHVGMGGGAGWLAGWREGDGGRGRGAEGASQPSEVRGMKGMRGGL